MFEPRVVELLDTTLRDGEQSSGLVFSPEQKVQLARRLAASGISHIEAGTPAACREEKESVQEIIKAGLSAQIYTWNRANLRDIDDSLDCGVRNLFISIPVSHEMIQKKLRKSTSGARAMLVEAVAHARKSGAEVTCGLEDATRSDAPLLRSFLEDMQEAGAARIRLADTNGVATPEMSASLVKFARSVSPLPVEFHAHNDFGLAVATSLAAVSAGAVMVDGTLLGVGERAGNASIEEMALALKGLYGRETGVDMQSLYRLLERFQEMIGHRAWPWKPVSGEKIFTCESGVHVDGLLKDPDTYRPYHSSLLGVSPAYTIGKHSGRSALQRVLRDFSIEHSPEKVSELLAQIKSRSIELRRSFSPEETAEVCRELLQKSEQAALVDRARENLENKTKDLLRAGQSALRGLVRAKADAMI